jgi:predicted permease
VSTAQAQADLAAIAGRLAVAYPQSKKDDRVILEDARFLDSSLRGPVTAFVGLMLGLAGLVLLTACANLANFFLVRAAGQRREMAVRTALGAGRGRLMRQVFSEAMCVALLGGAFGLLVTAWVSSLLSQYNPFPPSIPISIDMTPDHRVYFYTLGLTLLAGTLLGIAPARQAARVAVLCALKGEGGGVIGGASRLRAWFVAGQVALSLVLLISAGLFLRSLQNAGRVDVGFDPARVLAMDIDAGLKNWSAERAEQYYRDLTRRIGALPGVKSMTLANLMPLDIATRRLGVIVEGQEARAAEPLQVSFNQVSTGYFETLRIPLLSGRDFRETDAALAPGVVIVNQTMGARFWPGQDPLGKRFQLAPAKTGGFDTMMGGKWVEVIGVARDAKYRTLGEAPEAHVYLPYAQNFGAQRTLIVRVTGDPGAMISTVQDELRVVDSELLGFFARTAEQHMALAFLPARLAATLSSVFAALALALAALGLYGVVAWSVALRTREIGIRMALGAPLADVLRLVIGGGMKMVAGGIVIGLAAAFAATRFLASLLYGIGATDAPVFVGISLLLAAVALVACWVPARRATRVDPLVALRYE